MKKVRVANPGPAALITINPKGGRSMAARKRGSGTRRKTTRARSTARKTTRRNPSLSLSKRRTSRRRPVVARSRRRSSGRRRSNPSSRLVALVIGAGAAQIGASLVPFGGGPIVDALKVAGVGWVLERFLGRTVPSVFGEAKEGGMIAGGVLLFNAYLAPTIRSAVSNFMPKAGNGVQGIALTQYPFAPQLNAPMIPTAAPQKRGVNGMAAAAYPFR